jgi:flagellar protein FliS
MYQSGYAQYRTVTAVTASPGDLLLQLYQAAIKNGAQACEAIERGNIPQAHHHIARTQDILTELQRTLDHELGGEIARNLDHLYGYMLNCLLMANVHKERGPIDEVVGLLRQLLSAWQVAVRETRSPAQSLSEAVA